MISKIIASLKRSQRKRKVIGKILSSEQKNDGVVNLHRLDTRNVGDLYCAPHHYFEELKNSSLDIFDYKSEDKKVLEKFENRMVSSSIILGGGGLLNRGGFVKQVKLVEALGAKGKKTVIWGAGHNEKSPSTYGKVTKYNVDVSNFGLAGTRDYKMPGEYVPCVSCLHPLFSESYNETDDIGIIFHKDTLRKPEITSKFKDFPTSSNTTDMNALINFIGSCNKIVTDSYHTMYWSMLMGKKVVVVPNSSKFFDFKYMPVISTFDDALNQFGKAEVYPDLLEECRTINMDFSKKVFDYLEL